MARGGRMAHLDFVEERAKLRRSLASGAVRPGHKLAREPLLRRMLAVADVLAVVTVGLALALTDAGVVAAAWSIVFVPAWVLLAKLFGLYDRDHRALRHVTADEVQSIFLWSLTGAGALTLFLDATPAGGIPLMSTLLAWVVAFGSALLFRSGTRLLWRATTPPERTVILGTGPLADATRRKLELFPDIHVEVLGEQPEFTLDELEDLNGRLRRRRSVDPRLTDSGRGVARPIGRGLQTREHEA